MKKWSIVVTVLLFILAILCYLFFDLYRMKILEDELANDLLCGFFSHAGLCLLFMWMLYRYSGYSLLRFTKQFPKYLLWSLPCFMVAFINFPYSALISGEAMVDRKDVLGLYILYIISVAFLEEFIFRGSLYLLVDDLLRGKKHKPFFTVLICAGGEEGIDLPPAAAARDGVHEERDLEALHAGEYSSNRPGKPEVRGRLPR